MKRSRRELGAQEAEAELARREKELADVEAALPLLEAVYVANNTDKHANASDE